MSPSDVKKPLRGRSRRGLATSDNPVLCQLFSSHHGKKEGNPELPSFLVQGGTGRTPYCLCAPKEPAILRSPSVAPNVPAKDAGCST